MRVLILGLTLCFFAFNAAAQVVATCGASEGTAYYLPSELVKDKNVGWQQDNISNGGIILVIRDKKPQLLIMDAYQKLQDVEASLGAKLFWTNPGNNGKWGVLAIYDQAVESYVFSVDAAGNGEVAWVSSKTGALISKGAVYRAKCQSK